MNDKRCAGFTLGQLMVSLAMITLVALFLRSCFLIFSSSGNQMSRQAVCASNVKQIGLAMLQYSQDYDETFPPAAQPLPGRKKWTVGKAILSGWAVTHDETGEGIPINAPQKMDGSMDHYYEFGLLEPYVKNNQIFRCIPSPQSYSPLEYMYNDLAAGIARNAFTAAANSILICDGDGFGGSVGHAFDPNSPAKPATFSPKGVLLLSATLQSAPQRHAYGDKYGGGVDGLGANYGYADGHVKWCKPKSIFFPSRFSASRSHKDAITSKLLGPDPAQLNAKQADRQDNASYTGTFHIN